jgi:GGDEF domain-containing protein
MPEDDSLTTLHAAVNCYLTTLQRVADTLAEACPPMGGPYQQRLGRLRSRLAFDAGTEAIEESCAITSRELKEYAGKASGYVERHRVELRRAVAGLEDIIRTLAQRQDYYGERLRRFAMQMETTPYPTEKENLLDVVALQVAGLLSCVESMSNESQSLLKRMRDEMAAVETRLAETEITDPTTGLMNRREMERRIAAVQSTGVSPVLLRFDFEESLPDEVAQQVGARLGSQFRYNDLVSRWSDRQFLVLFQGHPETARGRAEQVVPWIAGRYLLDTGETVEVGVEALLLDGACLNETELAARL